MRAGFGYDDLFEQLDLIYAYLERGKNDMGMEMRFTELELMTLELEYEIEKAKKQAEYVERMSEIL